MLTVACPNMAAQGKVVYGGLVQVLTIRPAGMLLLSGRMEFWTQDPMFNRPLRHTPPPGGTV
jgi:hypothetical protein